MNIEKNASRKLGVFWSFLSAFLWATVYVATRWLMRGEQAKVDPVTLSLLRFSGGGLLLFLICLEVVVCAFRTRLPESRPAEPVFLRGDECFPVLGAALHDGDQLLHDHVKRSGPDDSAGAVHRGENLAPAGNRHGIGNAWLHDGDRSDCGTRVRIFSGEFPRGPAGACFGIKLVNRGSLREKSRDSRQRSCRNDLVDAVCLRLSPGHQLFPARGNHPASIGSSLEPDDLPCSFPDGARFLRMERGFGTCQPEPCDDHAVSDSDHDNPHGMGPAR